MLITYAGGGGAGSGRAGRLAAFASGDGPRWTCATPTTSGGDAQVVYGRSR